MYLDEIQDWIAVTQDMEISKSALHTLIRDAGITYKMLRKHGNHSRRVEQR